MKKYFIFLIMIVMILASGCSKKVIKHHYFFRGENDEWMAGMLYESTEKYNTKRGGNLDYSNHDNLELIITYKGKLSDLADVKQLQLGYKTSQISAFQTENYGDNGGPQRLSFTLYGSGENSHLLKKDEVIKITVIVDQVEQSFDIKVQ